MKTLNTFLEGLLNKSNKGDLINFKDIDVWNPDELATVFPGKKIHKQALYITKNDDNLCLVSGLTQDSNKCVPTFYIFIKMDGIFYDISVSLRENRQATELIPRELYVKIMDESDVIGISKNKYLWEVDINDARVFLAEQFKMYNKTWSLNRSCDYKVFEKWLGVKVNMVK